MDRVGIIPARGGSKRIPGKNIRLFAGKPIIAYSIEAALSSGIFSEVMVSTDDSRIADISCKFGAKIPFMRSAETADDFATTASVLQEVMNDYRIKLGREFKEACCIYPTAPFVTGEKLVAGHQLLQSGNYDSVFPIVKFSYPIWRALKKNEGNTIEMIWNENLKKRSQDFVPAFHDAGQWYWFVVEKFLHTGSLWMDRSHGLEISELEVQDIDSEVDWKLAELKYKLTTSNASG
jgi:pseudaminic acid cytidylyltransferase